MGDRVNCRLELLGEANTSELAHIIEAEWGEDQGEGNYFFEEVNWGGLPKQLLVELQDRKISFVWSWDAGSEYGPGMSIYDAKTNEMADYQRSWELEIVLTLKEAEDEGFRKEAACWQTFIQENPFKEANNV